MDLLPIVGQCDNGYACVYQNNLSWSSPTTPLPAEAHPRIVFERLFGEGGSAADRRAALRKRASLLDSVKRRDRAPAAASSGPADRGKVDRVPRHRPRSGAAHSEGRGATRGESSCRTSTARSACRPSYADHARLMFDLQVLALQGDVTRVITFQLARETSNRTYPEIGVSDPHHPLSHHGNDPEKIAKMAKINAFHVSLFAEFLAKLKATPEGDGTLLDHSLVLYGSGMGNPNVHDHVNLPIIVAGGAAGRHEGRAAHPLREADAAGQPAPDAARQGRRPARLVRRQQRARSTSCSSRSRRTVLTACMRLAFVWRVAAAWLVAASTGCRDRRRAAGRRGEEGRHARRFARSSQRRADVNAPQVDGMTALHWAAYQDDLETAQLLARGRRRRRRPPTATA